MQKQLRERLHKGRMLQQKEKTHQPLCKESRDKRMYGTWSYGTIQHIIECVLTYFFSKWKVTSTLQLFYTILCLALSLTEGKENPVSMVISYSAAYSGPANCSWPYVWQLEDFLTKKKNWAGHRGCPHTHHWRVLTTETQHVTFTGITRQIDGNKMSEIFSAC